MDFFLHCPELYYCEQKLSIEVLARSERFINDLPELTEMGYCEIGTIKKVSQVDAAISVAHSLLEKLNSPSVGRVIYCSFWNDEIWTEFHCAKVHSTLGLSSDASVTNLRVNGATSVFMAIELAQAYVSAHPDRGVLIVAADKVDARFVRRKFLGGLFGDGAAATYLSAHPKDSNGLWITSSPQFEIDGKFYRLDDYEVTSKGLNEASTALQTRLLDTLSSMADSTPPVTFLAQPGARFSGIEENKLFYPFHGDWSGRGYLPASGLMHVITDFLRSDSSHSGIVALGEASVGLQYAGLIAELDSEASRVT